MHVCGKDKICVKLVVELKVKNHIGQNTEAKK